jgi:hypothetical protein
MGKSRISVLLGPILTAANTFSATSAILQPCAAVTFAGGFPAVKHNLLPLLRYDPMPEQQREVKAAPPIAWPVRLEFATMSTIRTR